MTKFSLGRLEPGDCKKWHSFRNKHRSRPVYQFNDLVELEANRLRMNKSGLKFSNVSHDSAGIEIDSFLLQARLHVKKGWQELGIWGPHFEVLMEDSSPENAEKNECRHEASWLLSLEEDSNMDVFNKSRPANLFMHQVNITSKMLLSELPSRLGSDFTKDLLAIRPIAYQLVRSQWEDRRIWINFWGELPGNLWAHEIATEYWYSNDSPQNLKYHIVPWKQTRKRSMESYRRRVRKLRRRVRWTQTTGPDDTDCQSDDMMSSSNSESEERGTNMYTWSWKLHADMMHKQESMALGSPRRTASNSEVRAPHTLDNTPCVEKVMKPMLGLKAKSLSDEVASGFRVSMCLGDDCAAHTSFQEDQKNNEYPTRTSWEMMPGIFPGDWEQYITC
jgi:hypothetical protein